MAKTSRAAAAIQYSIAGTIYDAFEHPVANTRVLAYDKDFRTEEFVGEAVTDDKGQYTISYDVTKLAQAEYKTADIFIRVMNVDGTLLGESPVHFNVPEQFVLNLKTGDVPIRGLNEFDALVQLIQPLIRDKASMDELQEDKNKDISFLASETGEPQEKIALLPLAFIASQQTDMAPDIFYALFRLRFPTTLNELLLIKSESILSGLQQAITENIISVKWLPDLQMIVEKLNALATSFVLTDTGTDTKEFQQLLGAVLNQDRLQIFVTTWFAYEHSPEKFWDVLAQHGGFTTEVISDSQQLLQLHQLTRYNTPLTIDIHNEQNRNPALKELRALAVFTEKDWLARINSLVQSGKLTRFPEGIEGGTPAEQAAAYAAVLARTIQQRYPGSVLAERLKNDDAFGEVRSDLQTFLTNNKDFDPGTATMLTDLKNASFNNVQKKEQLVTELKTINRLYKLAGEYTPVSALRRNNITAAADIVLRFGKAQFHQQFADTFGSTAKATAVYEAAQSVHAKAMAVALKFKTMADVPVYAINGVQTAEIQALVSNNLEAIFNDATGCDCAECTSVHSPAAYLVDLLHFLKTQNPDAFAALNARRPDIANTKLTCANTNTPLPYIDLINEQLESLIVNQTTTAYDTTLEAAQLAMFPQNILQAAYDLLKIANAGYDLPLDLNLETCRPLLEKLVATRQAILEAFYPQQTTDIYEDAAIAREVLQLSTAELNVLNGTSVITGVTGNTAMPVVLAETDLPYTTLLELLQLDFVNPKQPDNSRVMTIVSNDPNDEATCDLTKLILQGGNAARIRGIIRFVRLQRKSGLTIEDLSKTFNSLAVTTLDLSAAEFNQRILIPLANLLRLQKRVSLTVQKIMALTGIAADPASLARAVRLSPGDFNKAVQVTGINPLGNSLATVLRFIDCLDSIRSTRLSLHDLHYVLMDAVSPLAQAPTVPAIAAVLEQLRNNLASIAQETGEPDLTNNNQAKAVIIDKISSVFKININAGKVLVSEVVTTGQSSLQLQLLQPSFYLSEAPLYHLDDAKNPVPDLPQLFSSYRHAAKLALLIRSFKLNTSEFDFLLHRASALGLDALMNNTVPVPFAVFQQLVNLVQWRNALPVQSPSWYDVLAIAIDNGTNAKSNYITALAAITTISKESLTTLLGNENNVNDKGLLQVSFPADYVQGRVLMQVSSAGNMAAAAGTTVLAFINAVNNSDQPWIFTWLIKKYTDDELLTMFRSVMNRSRKRSRNALLAYLLKDPSLATFRTSHAITDTASVFNFLLADVEMDTCMFTSRIKQAISCVQLFIDRCLMDLEPGVVLSDGFDGQWDTWRKQYRLWEANRKIFLYPENWIQPELRDDKTAFFKELESKLLQNEVNAGTVQDALQDYLQKLDTIAHPEVMGVFPEEATNTVHVVARTKNIPHQYFYRRQVNNRWTGWEKIDLDIEGDHVLPVIWNNRLLLFWAIFAEQQEKSTGGVVVTPGQPTPQKPIYLEMKLAWSEYKQGKWTARKVAKDAIKCPNHWLDITEVIGMANAVFFSLNSAFDNDKLLIHLFNVHTEYSATKQNQVEATFVFEYCNGAPYVTENYRATAAKLPPRMVYNKMWADGRSEYNMNPFSFYRSGPYKNEEYSGGAEEYPILYNNPVSFHVLPTHHEIEKGNAAPFVYSNNRHTFYVKAETRFMGLQDVATLPDGGIVAARKTMEPFSTKGVVGINGFTNGIPIVPAAIKSRSSFFYWRVYNFTTFYHPYACRFIKTLNQSGIHGLFEPALQNQPVQNLFSTTDYNPSTYVIPPYPEVKMDFGLLAPYSIYNWELFFHIPLFIATRLSQNQRFEESRQWFHYIFNPTIPATPGNDGPARFWITYPFKQEVEAGVLSIEELLTNPAYATELQEQLTYWEQHPFNPHAVARLRISAYMRTTVMKYIDNLIAWGDHLFKKDTIESINEATLLYVLAGNILGKRPEKVPARTTPVASTFNDIENQLGNMSLPYVEVELFIPPSAPGQQEGVLLMPLFCIPGNQQLLGYWDTVADRLFKIRHCMNIQGIVRQLPLFEPPIDPGLLARGVALGIDIGSIVNDINPILTNHRFAVMLQKANELCNDVKNLGNSLLAALEKRDAEQLVLLRSEHESSLLKSIQDTRRRQYDEAKENLNALIASRAVVENRQIYYTSRAFMNASEKQYYQSLEQSIIFQALQGGFEMAANAAFGVPDVKVASPFSAGATWGGTHVGHMIKAYGAYVNTIASVNSIIGNMANVMGSYERRSEEWTFQGQGAGLELQQIDKQIAAAEIRVAIAERELTTHELQMTQSAEVNEVLRSKFTNTELYEYMTTQIAAVYFQSYQLAYNTAKQAEKCLQHELGLEATSFIQFGYWDSLKKGLLSGEKLQYDLRRLENAYLEKNSRDLEISKHVSIALIQPASLLQLKETGWCNITLPESLFDLDFPGHYFRRIKSVSLSIPCIAGPYTSVNATLRLTGNEYRINTNATNGNTYRKTPEETSQPGSGRFRSVNHIVSAIATGQAQNDSGVFELNFRDERYLPFEGAGVTSTWRLELMQEPALRQFDYSTISDVLLHIKYTARDGGENLRNAATEHIQQTISEAVADGMPLSVLFNAKHDYAQPWHQFTRTAQPGVKTLTLPVNKSRLPFIIAKNNAQVTEGWLFARKKDASDTATIPFNENQTLVFNDDNKLFVSAITPVPIPNTTDNDVEVNVSMNTAEIEKLDDLFVLLKYIAE